MKRKIVIVLGVILTLLMLSLYYTYAVYIGIEQTSGSADITYNIDITDTVGRMISVEAGKTKYFDIFITNNNQGAISYGLAYDSDNLDDVTIAQVNTSKNKLSEIIENNTTHQISMVIINNSEEKITYNIVPVTGYEQGGDLIVPSGYSLITETYTFPTIPDLTFSDMTVDNQSIVEIPKGSYNIDMFCENAEANFDYENWKIKVYNMNVVRNSFCSSKFTTKTKNYLNNHVKSLSTADGVYQENGYRYEGKDVNNYIKFNGELWRIIGVFDSGSHGIENKYLTKISRDTTIGCYVWNTTSNNNWANSTLKSLLNDYYFKGINGNNTDVCYRGWATSPADCDFRSNGIKTKYQSMVENVVWYNGGVNATYGSETAEQYYSEERGTDVYEGHSATSTGHVGLMYLSDFGYATPASTCSRTLKLNTYGSTVGCSSNSWLIRFGEEYTITVKNSSSSTQLSGLTWGGVSTSYATNGENIRPVLYLKSDVYIISGNGSKGNPYIIGMD